MDGDRQGDLITFKDISMSNPFSKRQKTGPQPSETIIFSFIQSIKQSYLSVLGHWFIEPSRIIKSNDAQVTYKVAQNLYTTDLHLYLFYAANHSQRIYIALAQCKCYLSSCYMIQENNDKIKILYMYNIHAHFSQIFLVCSKNVDTEGQLAVPARDVTCTMHIQILVLLLLLIIIIL